MKIHEQRQGAVIVLKPEGALVEPEAAAFKQRLIQALGASLGRFVVDLSAVPFVDSKGLEALVEVTEEMGKSGQALRLCCGQQDRARSAGADRPGQPLRPFRRHQHGHPELSVMTEASAQDLFDRGSSQNFGSARRSCRRASSRPSSFRALAEQKASGRMLGEMLVEQNVISGATLVQVLARNLGVRGLPASPRPDRSVAVQARRRRRGRAAAAPCRCSGSTARSRSR